jgi:hypothetical protein
MVTYIFATDAACVLLAKTALLVRNEAGIALMQPLQVSLRQASPAAAASSSYSPA